MARTILAALAAASSPATDAADSDKVTLASLADGLADALRAVLGDGMARISPADVQAVLTMVAAEATAAARADIERKAEALGIRATGKARPFDPASVRVKVPTKGPGVRVYGVVDGVPFAGATLKDATGTALRRALTGRATA